MSVRSVSGAAAHCSGAIQSAVPLPVSLSSSPVRRDPKVRRTRTRPSRPIITLLGFHVAVDDARLGGVRVGERLGDRGAA